MNHYISQQDMKQSNLGNIFSLIRANAPLTRKEIAEKTNMSWGAVSKITTELLEKGYIIESKADKNCSAGPIPSYLEVCKDVHFSLGLDINDTGLRGVITNLSNEVVKSFCGEADFSDKDKLMLSLVSFIKNMLAEVKNKNVLCIGVAMQGIVDSGEGVSRCLPGREHVWQNLPIARMIEDKTGIPTHIEHDPNCILYAAHLPHERDAILIRADRGIGMAVMMDGEMIDKPGIFEIGHMTVEKNGIPCGCGKRGCLDQYASIRGIEKRSGKSIEALVKCAKEGDADAKGYISEAAEYLAFAINNAAHILNIDNVLLCGDLWESGEVFFNEFKRCFEEADPVQKTHLTFTNVLNAALGASMIASEITVKKIK